MGEILMISLNGRPIKTLTTLATEIATSTLVGSGGAGRRA
jgi:hypothetical protein